MKFNQLRYMTAVAETGSFSGAAEVCCVTQPTLSNGIAQLEKELGGKLFKRTTRSVTLTKFGAALLPLAQGVLEAQDELEHAAKSFFEPQARILRIGLSPLVSSHLLSGALVSFPSRGDWADVFLKQCFLDDLLERLDNDTLDLALLPRETRGHDLQAQTLYEEDLIYLPPNPDLVPVEATSAIAIEDLADQPIILTQGCGLSDVIAHMFEAAKVKLNRYPGQALSYQVVEEWAGLGIAGGILPRSKLSEAAQGARPILDRSGAPAMVAYEAVWTADGDGSDAGVAACADHLAVTMNALSSGSAA